MPSPAYGTCESPSPPLSITLGTRHYERVADVPAGVGYLAGFIAAVGAEVYVVRHRMQIGESLVDDWVSSARRAKKGAKWLYAPWLDPRLADPAVREEAAFWASGQVLFFLPVLAVVLLGAAVAAFVG